MKKNLISKMAIVIFATRLLACTCPECPQKPHKSDSDRAVVQTKKVATNYPTYLMDLQLAIPLVNTFSAKLANDPKYSTDLPKLENNVWQYIFPTNNLKINPNDQWILHKAFDVSTQKVCFVLEITDTKHAKSYFRGSVNCPRICGFTNGGLSLVAINEYRDKLLVQIERGKAESLMQNPQVNCAHAIQINWGQGIEYCYNHLPNLIQVIYGISETDPDPKMALLFPIDEYGKCMGNVWKIPPTQICIYHQSNECGLLPQ
ncbi:MAG: hypothetical protein JST06_10555 [Bacteroidetes bacterium]|nr:hypothetical protein [Bacteroidota bacterium]